MQQLQLLLTLSLAISLATGTRLGRWTTCEYTAKCGGKEIAPLMERLHTRTGWRLVEEGDRVSVLNDYKFKLQDGSTPRSCTLSVNSKVIAHAVPERFAEAVRSVHRAIRIFYRNQTVVLPVSREFPRCTGCLGSPPRSLWKMRGHQVAQSQHLYQFRTAPELAEFITDLSIFGTNAIEIAHVPGPTLLNTTSDALIAISEMLNSRGMNMSIWWSASFVHTNLDAVSSLFSRIPQLNSLFFPGGDGGTLAWEDIIHAGKSLRRYHPSSSIWVSAQEVNSQVLSKFISALTTNTTLRDTLGDGGAVYGPHNRVTLKDFVKALSNPETPGAYPVSVRQYPDLAHSLNAQFPVLGWDAPWAMAYARQVVNPRPAFFARLVRDRSNGSTPTRGVGAYSEGLNDDLNKALVSRMAEDASVTMHQALHEYARYFFGADAEADAVDALLGLEKNWQGRARENVDQVMNTLASLESAAHKSINVQTSLSQNASRTIAQGHSDQIMNHSQLSWRMAMYLRRGLMDAYVQSGHLHDLARSAAAKSLLQNNLTDCRESVKRAQSILASTGDGKIHGSSSGSEDTRRHEWLRRILDLTLMLNESIGAEVLQTQDTQLNLKSLHVPERLYSNYLLQALTGILNGTWTSGSQDRKKGALRQAVTESGDSCAVKVANLLSRQNPGSGGFYDDMGSVSEKDHPHLVSSNSVGGGNDMGDPSGYFSAVQGGYEITSATVPPEWLRYSMSFYDAPLVLRYDSLDKELGYKLKIVYWHPNRDSTDDIYRLTAAPVSAQHVSGCHGNCTFLIHDYMPAPNPMRELHFAIPKEVTSTGTLELACSRRPGGGGNGKTCEVSEVWIVPNQ